MREAETMRTLSAAHVTRWRLLTLSVTKFVAIRHDEKL
jgi:hypothetical protein